MGSNSVGVDMTTVYVAITSFDYEGCDEPIGVFSTREKAIAALGPKEKYSPYRHVIPYEIDMPVDLDRSDFEI